MNPRSVHYRSANASFSTPQAHAFHVLAPVAAAEALKPSDTGHCADANAGTRARQSLR
jgi:hypothetical protein